MWVLTGERECFCGIHISGKSIRIVDDAAASVSTPDQLLCVAVHGTVMRYAAEKRNLADSIAELREMAAGRDDVLAQAAGIEAGSWLHGPQRMSDTSSLLPNVDHSRRKQR